MDDTTQNPNPTPQVPGQTDMPVAPVSTPVSPVDPMDNAQVPNLPTAPVVSDMPAAPVVPVPSGDSGQVIQTSSGQAMEQMAATMPSMDPTPAPASVNQAQVDPAVTAPVGDNNMASLGPVTMEDLMEELQHIEDKLDEMDEKL